jgi:hypothetical protein
MPSVLTAAGGMMEQAVNVLAVLDGHLEGFFDQTAFQGGFHRPAHIFRENRSITTARYSRPTSVGTPSAVAT